ncbi:MAG: class I SAM-dependent methyltransferase [Rhodospirillales bacterium]|jgi:SAM-dependent methyltransferase|nr:class I SAM-dependent methyltransferase [Rhodospirillales bacterium]
MSKPDWNTRYAQADFLFGTAPNEFLRREAHRLPPASRVLCVADGEGRNGIWLAAQGHHVTSFDASSVAVEKARAWAQSRHVAIDARLSGVDEWDWAKDAFDAVVGIFVQFADPAMRRRLFAGIWRSLKPGGLLLVEGYTPKQLDHGTGGPRDLAHLYTEAMMRDLLPEAEFLLLRSYEAEIEEGPAHSGLSALLDLVARRPAA